VASLVDNHLENLYHKFNLQVSKKKEQECLVLADIGTFIDFWALILMLIIPPFWRAEKK